MNSDTQVNSSAQTNYLNSGMDFDELLKHYTVEEKENIQTNAKTDTYVNMQKTIENLPDEILIDILKMLSLRKMQLLARTNKRFYGLYERINNNAKEKISFNSRRDSLQEFQNKPQLKEIIIDLYHVKSTYGKALEFCFSQPLLEKLTIKGVSNENFKYEDMPIGAFRKLKHVQLSILNYGNVAMDYLLPILESTRQLKTLKLRNVILTSRTMMEISLNNDIHTFQMENVMVLHIRAFKYLLTRMDNVVDFTYKYHHFIHLNPILKTINEILAIDGIWKKLKNIKINAWQALNQETYPNGRKYTVQAKGSPINKGIMLSFLETQLPLLMGGPAHQIHIYYSNSNHPYAWGENASLVYNITDNIDGTTYTYRYYTSP